MRKSIEYYKSLNSFILNDKEPGCQQDGYVFGMYNDWYTIWHVLQNGCNVSYKYMHQVTKDESVMKEIGLPLDKNLVTRKSFYTHYHFTYEGIFNFGKYYGKSIAECTDWKYLMWYALSDDTLNKTLCINTVLNLNSDIDFDSVKNEFFSYKRVDNILFWKDRIKKGTVIKLDLNTVNSKGRIWADGFWFEFPYKYYSGNEYHNGYSLIINPENGKAMRTKGKGYKVFIYNTHISETESNVAIVDEYEIVK